MPTVTVEKRRRGPFGWAVAALFWGWNAYMAYAVIRGVGGSAERYAQATTDAAQAGTAAGATIATGALLVLWAVGTVILGAMVAFTRGKKVVTTREVT